MEQTAQNKPSRLEEDGQKTVVEHETDKGRSSPSNEHSSGGGLAETKEKKTELSASAKTLSQERTIAPNCDKDKKLDMAFEGSGDQTKNESENKVKVDNRKADKDSTKPSNGEQMKKDIKQGRPCKPDEEPFQAGDKKITENVVGSKSGKSGEQGVEIEPGVTISLLGSDKPSEANKIKESEKDIAVADDPIVEQKLGAPKDVKADENAESKKKAKPSGRNESDANMSLSGSCGSIVGSPTKRLILCQKAAPLA